MEIKFKHVAGPYSDETSVYDVIFPDGILVKDFISHIVNERSIVCREWGYFIIQPNNGTCGSRVLFYSRGDAQFDDWCPAKVCKNILREVKDCIVAGITAQGGWSRIDYIITFKEAPDDAN